MYKGFSVLLLIASVCFASAAEAVTISVVGGGFFDPATAIGTSHQLEIHVSTAPENVTFTNGGIELKLESTSPSVIDITGATVLNPTVFGFAPRWSVAQAAGVGLDEVELLQGASVSTPALTTGDPSNTIGPNLFLFARINYTITGGGFTQLLLSGFDGLNDFINMGQQVVPELHGGVVYVLPEPHAIVLAGMGVMGLLVRRRNG